MLLKAAIPFNCSSPEYLSPHKKRKNRVSPASRAHMNRPSEITLLWLNLCYYTSGNLNQLNMNSSSSKTFSQINDCLFYVKFKAMDHAFQHVPHIGRRKELFVCAYGVLHYGQLLAAAVEH